MSQFGGRAAQESVRRQGVQMRSGGATTSLNAPGVVAAPPVSSGSAAAARMLQTIDNFSGVMGSVASFARDVEFDNIRKQEREERQRYLAQEAAEKAAKAQADALKDAQDLLRGDGSQIADESFTEITAPIVTGATPIPSDPKLIRDFASELASQYADQNGISDPVMRQAFLEKTIPRIASAISAKQIDLAEKAKTNLIGSLESAVYLAAANGEDIGEIVSRNTNVTGIEKDEIVRRSVAPNLVKFADVGDRKGFERVASFLGSEYLADIQLAGVRLDSAEKRDAIERRRQAQNEVYTLLSSFGSDESKVSYNDIQERINGYAASGLLDLEDKDRYLQRLDQKFDEQTRAEYAKTAQFQIDTAVETGLGAVEAGLLAYVQDAQIEVEPGKFQVIPSEQLREMVMKRAFDDIAAQPNKKPIEKQREMIAISRMNGYEPKEWKSSIEDAMVSLSSLSFASDNSKDGEKVADARIQAALGLYAELRKDYPEYTTTIEEDTSSFFDNVLTRTNAGQPLTEAIQATQRARRQPLRIDNSHTTTFLKSFKNEFLDRFLPFTDRESTTAMEGKALSVFSAEMANSGGRVETATENAIAKLKAMQMDIGKSVVFVPGATISNGRINMSRTDFSRATDDWLEEVVPKLRPFNHNNGKDLKVSDVMVEYDDKTAQWYFTNKNTGAPIRTGPNETSVAIYSTSGMLEMLDTEMKKKIAEKNQKMRTQFADPRGRDLYVENLNRSIK